MRFLAVLLAAVLLLYPVFVYLGTQWLEPRYLGLAVLGLYLLRGIVVSRSRALRFALLIGSGLLALAVWWLNSDTLLLLVPALINAAMAAVFAYSLFNPPTIPARVAQRLKGELTPQIKHYTTQVTRLWISFFCLNTVVSLATALWASRELWLLYNGGIAYVLVGALFVGEYAYRRLVINKNDAL